MVSGKDLRKFGLFLVLVVTAMHFLASVPSVWSGPVNNYRNYTVRTTVNVTDAYPEVINTYCGNASSGGVNYLLAGTTQNVTCTVMLRDYNGAATIDNVSDALVNATLYYINNNSADEDNNNYHYSNTSCVNSTGVYGSLSEYVNYTCSFHVWYYAINGTWRLNVTVVDFKDLLNLTSLGGNTTTIAQLYALNVTDVVDFGKMYVGETTALPGGVQANITNFGNVPINFTVYGYGGDSITTGLNLAMRCDQRNITVSNLRYYIANDVPVFEDMIALTSSAVKVINTTIPKQFDSEIQYNSTYWALRVNATNNPYGVCNGTLVFSSTPG